MVDTIDKPSVVEYVEQQMAILHAFVGFTTDLDDVLTGFGVDDKPSVLLLNIVGHL